MRSAVFTVDVDRDVNLPVNGRKQALSKCHDGEREEVRFDSSLRGMTLLCRILKKAGIRATFFFEGDTLLHIADRIDIQGLLANHEAACHGVCHEDITGESTGTSLSNEELCKMIDESKHLISQVFAQDPVGFRAPYQHIDQRTFELLCEKGFLYDSSLTRPIDEKDGGIRPWKVAGDLWEMPLAQGKDDRGKRIVSYLWPMHEGKRRPDDYVKMAASMRAGVLVLATHTWHMTETYGDGILSEDAVSSNLKDIQDVLQGIMDQGLEFITLQELAESMED